MLWITPHGERDSVMCREAEVAWELGQCQSPLPHYWRCWLVWQRSLRGAAVPGPDRAFGSPRVGRLPASADSGFVYSPR